MKKILLVFATLVWLGFWWWWYTCKMCSTCLCGQKATTSQIRIQPETGLILFTKNDTTAMIQPGWPGFRDSLSSSLQRNDEMNIEGQYTASETHTSTYENLGLARANNIRNLFPDSLLDQIKTSSLLIEERPAMNEFPFNASSITVKAGIVNTESEKIQQTGDKTTIYFNSNSDQRIKDPELEKFLSQLATQQKDQRSAFVITGYTDDRGPEDKNIRLGQRRADVIKNYLIEQGIEAERITANSKGESMPLADNNTPEGRKKNRRTEIEIFIKQ